MKRIIVILITIALTTISCQNELLQEPITNKVSGKFYTNEKELEEAVNAVYASLQFTGNFNTAIPAIGEIPGEDAYDATPANDGGVYGQLDDYNVIPQNGLIGTIWQDAYKGIQRANIVINRIENVTYENNDTKQARIGEMKFIRALYYFNLVRIFGNVPLIIDEVENPQDFFDQKRAATTEVYSQIKADLEDAISKLPTRNDSNKGRVVKSAAYTLLGKVALTLKEYADAKTQLLKVVNTQIFKLIDADKVFAIDNELNEEIIFAVQYASGINTNKEGSDAYRMFNPTSRVVNSLSGAKGHGVLKESFYNLYAATDARKDVYVGKLSSGEAYNNKIAVPTTVITDAGSDWVVLRYADVLLMLAEIENALNNQDQAIFYVNEIRKRAKLTPYTGTKDKNTVFNEIDLQRRLELVWEGHRWFDLLRQERAQTVLGITDINKLLMPIPASQIAASTALTQNPGY
ncbi:RagB/SusD family nutrient uptake outer membrane protein [Polaribacter batillariae]|uniref:RagB/SusD family nutrient uptake outer membrane protein n=1 Tax=Polaribacter batillariae TaxID=2808900 RepID=A0ABX7T0P0_9FLAO|nr:RagB/SusD family nutrient uptake outer membrane protein [Polaribacter batillariae]QTD38579.1 RagB/SusD family nutrient uptake outer membrane protein [Polaribacter batillariae]